MQFGVQRDLGRSRRRRIILLTIILLTIVLLRRDAVHGRDEAVSATGQGFDEARA